VVAFYGSLLALIASVGAIMAYGKRRPIGTAVTWGESIAAALILFWIMFLAYGIVPDVFLKWADGQSLNWRSDSVGIPAGKLHDFLSKDADNFWYNHENNVLFPKGISIGGRGRILVSKQTVRDILAANIYIVFLGAHMKLWAMWQRRGKKAAELAKLEPTSSFGRPLVKKA
jgi:hypothetical protein